MTSKSELAKLTDAELMTGMWFFMKMASDVLGLDPRRTMLDLNTTKPPQKPQMVHVSLAAIIAEVESRCDIGADADFRRVDKLQ